MRLGLYGGTFDPIHRGHVEPVLTAKAQLSLDRVLYLPTAQPPHKQGRDPAPAWRRFAMVELALLDWPDLEVSPFEMAGEPAFTIDTVEHFKKAQPADQLFLLIGADSFLALDTWRRGDELVRALELIVLARPGFRLEDQALAEPQRTALGDGRVHLVTNPPIAASATEIRRQLRAGHQPPDEWLEPRVLDYLRKYRLYLA